MELRLVWQGFRLINSIKVQIQHPPLQLLDTCTVTCGSLMDRNSCCLSAATCEDAYTTHAITSA